MCVCGLIWFVFVAFTMVEPGFGVPGYDAILFDARLCGFGCV